MVPVIITFQANLNVNNINTKYRLVNVRVVSGWRIQVLTMGRTMDRWERALASRSIARFINRHWSKRWALVQERSAWRSPSTLSGWWFAVVSLWKALFKLFSSLATWLARWCSVSSRTSTSERKCSKKKFPPLLVKVRPPTDYGRFVHRHNHGCFHVRISTESKPWIRNQLRTLRPRSILAGVWYTRCCTHRFCHR